jgi:hypothetical protein
MKFINKFHMDGLRSEASVARDPDSFYSHHFPWIGHDDDIPTDPMRAEWRRIAFH